VPPVALARPAPPGRDRDCRHPPSRTQERADGQDARGGAGSQDLPLPRGTTSVFTPRWARPGAARRLAELPAHPDCGRRCPVRAEQRVQGVPRVRLTGVTASAQQAADHVGGVIVVQLQQPRGWVNSPVLGAATVQRQADRAALALHVVQGEALKARLRDRLQGGKRRAPPLPGVHGGQHERKCSLDASLRRPPSAALTAHSASLGITADTPAILRLLSTMRLYT
jgi:hypothetical protein